MSTSSLTFPMTDATGDLVFSGNLDANPLGLISMNRPAWNARVGYAEAGEHVDGNLPNSASWGSWTLSAVVQLDGTSQADLDTKVARVVEVVGQFSYTFVQEWNGVSKTYRAHRGSVVPTEDVPELWELDEFSAVYTLSIPVQPHPVGA